VSRARASIVIGVQNVFDRIYAASLAVNAARGKFYEPASRRSLFAGISFGASTGEMTPHGPNFNVRKFQWVFSTF